MKTIVVTGCTGSIGGAAVKMLREKGYDVIGTTRREPRVGERRLDVGSLASVVAFVERLKADGIKVDGLMTNGAYHNDKLHLYAFLLNSRGYASDTIYIPIG
ncbi:MAG: NAD-dependent epimerase/dehydratase family protein [Bacteroidales bacterium]|nr:NAD-dependent epimerase/dehydratase family protein [Bacteroidales bacterium]